MIHKKVLLVCYAYPPNPGVGGRRWAKISKYFRQLGVDQKILMKEPADDAFSPWTSDVSGIYTMKIKPVYPGILDRDVRTIADKLLYRLWLLLLRLITRSNYYDRTVLMEHRVVEKISQELQKSQTNNLIITGAPFSLLYYGALVKKAHPELFYIADIRDSWLNDNYYGFGLISEKRRRAEKKRLLTVLEYADKIIVPYQFMKDDYALMGGGKRMVLHEHGYDEDLISDEISSAERDHTLVNFGSHYFGLDKLMIKLAGAVEKTNYAIEFYTNDEKYKSIFSGQEAVKYFHPVPEHKVMHILGKSRAAILFTNEKIKDMVSTKYIETVATKTPIIVIGKRGEASRFIESNRLGLFIEESEIALKLPVVGQLLDELDYNKGFDISRYSLKRQANEIAGWLI